MSKIVVNKRKRVVLTIETKLRIIQRLQLGESAPKLATEFNVGAQTVRDIFRKKDELLKFVSAAETFNAVTSRKTIKGSSFEQIDSALYAWFKEECSHGHFVSHAMLAEKAQWFHKELKIAEPFIASPGWLQRFRSRHGIHGKVSVGSSNTYIEDNVSSPGKEIISPPCVLNFFCGGDNNHLMESNPYLHQENQAKDDDTIIPDTLLSVDMVDSSEEGDFEGDLINSKNVTLERALNSAETLLKYLKQEDDTSYCDISNLQKIYMSIKMKMSEKTRQLLMTDFYQKL